MAEFSLSLDDLCYHQVTFGMDVYPPVVYSEERTRLNIFYERAGEEWGHLFDRLTAGDEVFRIAKAFRKRAAVEGPAITLETFVLTQRGPVFVFPFILPDPVGATGLEETHRDDFTQVRRAFESALPGRFFMRVGLIRELVFSTGQARCSDLVTDVVSFGNAQFSRGEVKLTFKDEQHNHTIAVSPVTLNRTTHLPVGTRVEERAGYGVRVILDVNNRDVRKPLSESDIDGVLDRAASLWPKSLLDFLMELPRSH